MGIIKTMFGGGGKSPPPTAIETPDDLKVGDMVKWEFADQTLISAKTLKVSEQVFYDISAVEKCKTVSFMTGADQRILLSTSTVNPESPLEVAVAILPERVFEVFKRKQFAAIFDEPDDTDHRLKSKEKLSELGDLQGFVSASYFQERTNEAYRSTTDCRGTQLMASNNAGFDYKLMVSDDRKHAIRIEVFDGGRTDVYLIAYLPYSKIETYWPS